MIKCDLAILSMSVKLHVVSHWDASCNKLATVGDKGLRYKLKIFDNFHIAVSLDILITTYMQYINDTRMTVMRHLCECPETFVQMSFSFIFSQNGLIYVVICLYCIRICIAYLSHCVDRRN